MVTMTTSPGAAIASGTCAVETEGTDSDRRYPTAAEITVVLIAICPPDAAQTVRLILYEKSDNGLALGPQICARNRPQLRRSFLAHCRIAGAAAPWPNCWVRSKRSSSRS